ncbi:MAG: hypothetical protein NC082_02495 [Clostridiales bacterium]|nr:hypothetical protein [Clostridiales bacterium]
MKLNASNRITFDSDIIYMTVIDPVSENGDECALSRGQFIYFQYQNRIKRFKLDDTDRVELIELLEQLEVIDSVPYDTYSLGLEWNVDSDTIISLKNVSEPVIGVILLYKKDIPEYGLFKPEIIWLCKNCIYIGTYKCIYGKELTEFIGRYKQKKIIPKEYYTSEIVKPVR